MFCQFQLLCFALLSAFSLSASERKVQLCTKSVADLLYVQAMKGDRGEGEGERVGSPILYSHSAHRNNIYEFQLEVFHIFPISFCHSLPVSLFLFPS